MINFNKDTIWNLHPIDVDDIRDDVNGLLIPGETAELAFQTLRDQLVFTNKRIISIDIQGMTGKRKSYASLPYSKIQFFSIQTPGFAELIPDAELKLTFSNGFSARFQFRGNVDVGRLGRMISKFVL